MKTVPSPPPHSLSLTPFCAGELSLIYGKIVDEAKGERRNTDRIDRRRIVTTDDPCLFFSFFFLFFRCVQFAALSVTRHASIRISMPREGIRIVSYRFNAPINLLEVPASFFLSFFFFLFIFQSLFSSPTFPPPPPPPRPAAHLCLFYIFVWNACL